MDGMRLSHTMGRKNALAGLLWSGGQAIIASGPGGYVHDKESTFKVRPSPPPRFLLPSPSPASSP